MYKKKVELKFNMERREVFKNGQRIKFSPIEFSILNVIKTNYFQVLTRDNIIKKVWNGKPAHQRTVDHHIAHIRKRLGRESIETVNSFGYRIGLGYTGDT